MADEKLFCTDIAEGLLAPRLVGFVHGTSGDNILLFTDPKVESLLICKISDFGYSAAMEEGRSNRGSRIFCAPMHEVARNWENKPSADKYSFGLVVWKIAKDCEEPFAEWAPKKSMI